MGLLYLLYLHGWLIFHGKCIGKYASRPWILCMGMNLQDMMGYEVVDAHFVPSIRHFPASVQTASSGNLLTAYDFVVKHGLGMHT